MTSQIHSKKLVGMKVYGGKRDKRLGKVRSVVLHPQEKRVVGYLVHRPDAALMFHRKDGFVYFSDGKIVDGVMAVGLADTSAKALAKREGVSLDKCVLWTGMPLVSQSGELLGYVNDIVFDEETGTVHSVTSDNGATANLILGKLKIPAKYILGFRLGLGEALVETSPSDDDFEEELPKGAILVSDKALALSQEGGVAASAGKATAVVTNKAKTAGSKAKAMADAGSRRMKPHQDKALAATEKAVSDGGFALGKQLGKAGGMFAAFKEEYQKAVSSDDEKPKE